MMYYSYIKKKTNNNNIYNFSNDVAHKNVPMH